MTTLEQTLILLVVLLGALLALAAALGRHLAKQCDELELDLAVAGTDSAAYVLGQDVAVAAMCDLWEAALGGNASGECENRIQKLRMRTASQKHRIAALEHMIAADLGNA